MSILIGIDLVCADEVQESIAAHGERYLERLWTQEEVRDCQHSASCLAATFAAKEAAMKALQRDDEPLGWRSISVRRPRDGQPSIELTGAAAELARLRGAAELSVSVAGQGRLAAAAVVAHAEPRR